MRRQTLFVVSLFIATAAIAAELTPERAVVPAVLGPAPYAQASPSIASDGDGFFVAWRDNRLGLRTTTIVGTRLDRNGNPLDGGGLLFNRPDPADDIFYSGNPYVLWTGTDFAIFWPEEEGTMQARVSREGEFVLNSRTPVSGERVIGAAQIGAVSAILTQFSTEHVMLIGSDGVIANVEIPAVAQPETELQSLIASNGSEFVVATMILRSDCSCVEIRAIRIKPDGTITSTLRSTTSLIQGSYAFAASGDRYFFAASSLHGLTGRVFDAALQPKIDSVVISSDTTPNSVDGFPVIADGDSFVVAWPQGQNGATIMAQRFTRDGAPTGPRITVATTTTLKSSVGLARNLSERVETVWAEQSAGPAGSVVEMDVAGRPFTTDGTAVTPAPVTISLGAPSQEQPAATYNGTNYLLAWIEQRGVTAGRRLVATRLSREGVALDNPIDVGDVSLDSASYDVFGPAVASNGRDFLIVWVANGGLSFRRLASDGSWLDAAPRLIPSDKMITLTSQAVVWNGSEYLVAFTNQGEQQGVVEAVTISSYGTAGQTRHLGDGGKAVVAAMSNDVLVVWSYTTASECMTDVCRSDLDIVGKRVAFDGTVLDTTPIAFSTPHRTGDPFDNANEPSIAASGGSALVFWRTDDARYGTRFANGAADTGGTVLSRDPSASGNLIPAWDGRTFHAFGTEASNGRDATWTLYDVPSTGPLSLMNAAMVASNLTIGAGTIETTSSGGILVAYPHVVFGPDTGHVNRMFVRTSPPHERSRAIRR